ncbi:MAG: glycosyltransferase, partial [Chloroflexi bacterium]|nr:glycosyltransferase [Chloroflexota bacterium]
ATVAAAVVYSAPPVRTRERPILDLATGALHLVLPAVCGLVVSGVPVSALAWPLLLAFLAWAMASHALAAVQRLAADRAADSTSSATALGARPTAGIALLGYLLAAVLTATSGSLGVLAAVGLALYLLLPTMILGAPGADPSAPERAARQAWHAFLGLNLLVGLWLSQILLRHWSVTTFGAWDLAVTGITGLTVLVLLQVTATRLLTSRRQDRRGASSQRSVETLTAVVAGLNESSRLRATLAALRSQTYADVRILVVDDGSTGGGPSAAVDAIGSEGLLAAPPAPPGWSATAWARHIGAHAAETDLVMFVDADTVLAPVTTRLLVAQLEVGRFDLLSGISRDALPTVGERATVPGFALLRFGLAPVWWSALTAGRPAFLAFAGGSLMLVRREAYLAVGGHAANPGSGRADIDLARAFSRAGRRVGTVHAADLAETRHASGALGVLGAWRRSILPGAGGSLALAIVTVIIEALAFLGPLVLPLAAWLAGVRPPALLAALAPLAVLLLARTVLAVTQRQSLLTIAWHPVTIVVTLAGQLLGIADHALGREPAQRRRALSLTEAAAADR